MDLSDVLGQLLPSAVGIAISPVPIIASVLMLLSRRAKQTAPAFAVGWLLGLVGVSTIVILLAGVADSSNSDSSVSHWIKLLVGVAFTALAVLSWQRRPRPGQRPAAPRWMAHLDSMKPGLALGLGVALSALNPKNLALVVAASVSIAGGGLSAAATVACVVVLVVIASLLVAGPVVAYFLAHGAMVGPLKALKSFMQAHNAAIVTVLLAVLGLSEIGEGLGGLLG